MDICRLIATHLRLHLLILIIVDRELLGFQTRRQDVNSIEVIWLEKL